MDGNNGLSPPLTDRIVGRTFVSVGIIFVLNSRHNHHEERPPAPNTIDIRKRRFKHHTYGRDTLSTCAILPTLSQVPVTAVKMLLFKYGVITSFKVCPGS